MKLEVTRGGPEVFRTTRERAAESRIALAEVSPWYDVDDGAALDRQVHAAQPGAHVEAAEFGVQLEPPSQQEKKQ